MEQIDQQGVPTQRVQQGEAPSREEPHVPTVLMANAEKEVAGQIQEEPRNQREIIGGEKATVGKTQIGSQIVAVDCFGQPADDKTLKSQRAIAAIAKKKEKTEM